MQGEIREKPDSKGFRLPDPYKFHPQLRVFGAPSDVPNLVQGDTPRLDDVKSKRAYPGHLFKLLDTGLVTPSFINASDKKAQEITDKARVGADKSRKSAHARRTPPNRNPPPTPAPSPEQDAAGYQGTPSIPKRRPPSGTPPIPERRSPSKPSIPKRRPPSSRSNPTPNTSSNKRKRKKSRRRKRSKKKRKSK